MFLVSYLIRFRLNLVKMYAIFLSNSALSFILLCISIVHLELIFQWNIRRNPVSFCMWIFSTILFPHQIVFISILFLLKSVYHEWKYYFWILNLSIYPWLSFYHYHTFLITLTCSRSWQLRSISYLTCTSSSLGRLYSMTSSHHSQTK